MSENAQPAAEPIVMRPEHTQHISRLMFLKSYVQSQLDTLDAELTRFIRIAYGVDISQEDWHADLENGVLSRVSGNNES